MFIIDDDIHCELQDGEYNSFDEALHELKRRSLIPWDEYPNRCPCTSWKTCERNYSIIEYDPSSIPYKEIQKVFVLTISAKGVNWT